MARLKRTANNRARVSDTSSLPMALIPSMSRNEMQRVFLLRAREEGPIIPWSLDLVEDELGRARTVDAG